MFVYGLSLFACVRQNRHVSGAFDRRGQRTLMDRTGAGHPAGQDFTAFRDKLAQTVPVFVIDQINVFRAEGADFSAAAARTLGTEFSLALSLVTHSLIPFLS